MTRAEFRRVGKGFWGSLWEWTLDIVCCGLLGRHAAGGRACSRCGVVKPLPKAQQCRCGHRVRWYVEAPADELDQLVGWDPGVRMVTDVVERPCRHRNGTVIEHCPRCDRPVGRWGFGVVGTMDCRCWDRAL